MRCDGVKWAPEPVHARLEKLALDLVKGAFLELYLTPKPGLVDLCDSGSHPDLSVAKMEASLQIVSGYLHDLSEALRLGKSLAAQVELGIAAESLMMKSIGTNCHRGFIFLSGLLLSASAQVPVHDEEVLREAVARLSMRFFARGEDGQSNGGQVRARFKAGGVKAEALAGLPGLFDHALPAFRKEIALGGSVESAAYAMLGRLMQSVEDSTALHRCGREGLRTLRRDGRKLERLVAGRGDYFAYLTARNAHYVEQNLTMGGCADLLALAFAWLSHTGELAAVTMEISADSCRESLRRCDVQPGDKERVQLFHPLRSKGH